MPRRDCWCPVYTQTYDRTSKFPWKLHRQKHLFCHKNQNPLGKSYVECWGVLISWIQTHSILRFDSWTLIWTVNTEGKIISSFRVPYQIWGLWQYLEIPWARKAYISFWERFPHGKTVKGIVNGSKTFFRSNSDSFTFHYHPLFVKGNYCRIPIQSQSRDQHYVRISSKKSFGQHVTNPDQQTFQKSLRTHLWV